MITDYMVVGGSVILLELNHYKYVFISQLYHVGEVLY